MTIHTLVPKGAVPPLAPYSAGTRAGNTIYVSGTLPIGMSGETVGIGDITAQTHHVIQLIEATLEAGGANLSDVAFNQIFLKDLGDYQLFNEVYREYFGKNPPARYCIRADLVKPEFLVEISSTAYIGD